MIKQHKDESPQNNLLKYAKAGVFIFLVVVFLEIWMVNRLSSYGVKIQQLKDTEASLQLQNQELSTQLAQNLALENVQTKATALGFAPVVNYDYFKDSALASAIR